MGGPPRPTPPAARAVSLLVLLAAAGAETGQAPGSGGLRQPGFTGDPRAHQRAQNQHHQQLEGQLAGRLASTAPEGSGYHEPAAEPAHIELVVSGYCFDDWSWAARLNCSSTAAYLYTKCDREGPLSNVPKNLPPCVRVELLPNVGREGATYLHHLRTHYDRLKTSSHQPGAIVFLQGTVSNWSNSGSSLQLVEALDNARDWVRAGVGFAPLSYATCANRWSCPKPDLLMNLIEFLMRKPVKTHWMASYKGQFIVSKARAARVPRWLYEYGLGLLESESGSLALYGHALERSWNVIFGCWEFYRYRHRRAIFNEAAYDDPHNVYPACFDDCSGGDTCGPNQPVAWEGVPEPPPSGEPHWRQAMLRDRPSDEQKLPRCPAARLLFSRDQRALEAGHGAPGRAAIEHRRAALEGLRLLSAAVAVGRPL